MLPPVRSTKLCFFAPGRHRGDPPITSSPPDPAVGGVHTFWGGGQARGWGAPPRSRVVMGVSPHKQRGCRGGAGGGGMVCCRKCLLHVAPHRGAQPPRLRLCNPGGTAGQRLCLGGHCQL